jgi:hypothetical protein
LLRSNAWGQRQQIKPRRDIENRGVHDKIYCEDAIEDGGHLYFLFNRLAFFNAIVTPLAKPINSQPSANRSQLLSLVTGHASLMPVQLGLSDRSFAPDVRDTFHPVH